MGVPDGQVLVLTGAAGRVAARLRAALRDRYRLRLTDVRDLPEPPHDGESFLRGDLAEPGFAGRLVAPPAGCGGVDAAGDAGRAGDVDAARGSPGVAGIIHLAGEADPGAGWDALLHSNLRGTAALFDAAAGAGVPKLVYASSVHAVGGYLDPATWPVDPRWTPRPCCRYGVSKVAGEAMARLYADQVPDASVVVARLGLVTIPPRWRHEVRGWLSDGDLVRLVRAALDARVRYGVYFGVSRSDGPRYRVDGAERDIGYRPRDAASPAGLTGVRPAYPDNCRLWRIPPAALDPDDVG